MKRYGFLILIAVAACSPKYESGKTQCSTSKECPSGFSCKDDGTSAVHYCFDNKTVRPQGCPATAGFYCSQSDTCWAKPGVCSTVALCNTAKHPGNVICATANYHPDCNGDTCLPNGVVTGAGGALGFGGAVGFGGITGKGGTIGTVIGIGGALGVGGMIGTGGIRDASPDGPGGITGAGGLKDACVGGVIGAGGAIVIGLGGAIGRGGALGTGGATGKGGAIGAGGGTGTTLCSGTPYTCSGSTTSSECASDTGCIWNATTSTCSGTPTPCAAYTSSTYCIYNGCHWSGTLTCSPTAMSTACSTLAATSSSSACDVCVYTSCCGQLTNCSNDTTCTTYGTGPLFDAEIACLANCCASTCGLNK
jgi:hypothetical protein